MPQIKPDIAEKYYTHKTQAGYLVESLSLPAYQLNPTQSEMHRGVILKIYEQAKKGNINPCELENNI